MPVCPIFRRIHLMAFFWGVSPRFWPLTEELEKKRQAKEEARKAKDEAKSSKDTKPKERAEKAEKAKKDIKEDKDKAKSKEPKEPNKSKEEKSREKEKDAKAKEQEKSKKEKEIAKEKQKEQEKAKQKENAKDKQKDKTKAGNTVKVQHLEPHAYASISWHMHVFHPFYILSPDIHKHGIHIDDVDSIDAHVRVTSCNIHTGSQHTKQKVWSPTWQYLLDHMTNPSDGQMEASPFKIQLIWVPGICILRALM